MKRLIVLAVALLAARAYGQTVVNGSRIYAGGVEAGSASYFRPMTVNGVPSASLCNTALSITSSTNATPVVITKNGHGLSNGQVVTVYGHGVNTPANGTWMVGSATANTFALCAYWDGTTCQGPAVGIAGGGNSGFFSTQVGRVAVRNDATPGQNWYFCTDSTGSPAWTQQVNSGGGGGSPGGVSGQVEYNNSGAFGGFTPGGDVSLVIPNVTVLKIDGTSVPVNAAADQVLLTTGPQIGSWGSIPSCLDSAGQHLNYNTSTHILSCGTTSSGSGIGGSGSANSIPLFTGVTTIGNSNLQQPLDGSVNSIKALTWAAAAKPTFNGGGTTTCDLSQSNVCEVDFGTANTTLALSNPHGSGPYTLRSCQDSVGSRRYTAFPGNAVKFVQPRFAANACTEMPFTYDGTNYNAWTTAGAGAISEVNAQSGTTYTFLSADCGKLVQFSNASPVAVTLPQAGAAFPATCLIEVVNEGAGDVTITPTTSTLGGSTAQVISTTQSGLIMSDGVNYDWLAGTNIISGLTTGCSLKATSAVTARSPLNLCQDVAGDDYFTKALALAPTATVTYVNAGTSNLDLSLGNNFSLTCTTANGTTTIGLLNAPTGAAWFQLSLINNGTTGCSVTYPASFATANLAGFCPGLGSKSAQFFTFDSVASKYVPAPGTCDDAPGVIRSPEAGSAPVTGTYCNSGFACLYPDPTSHFWEGKQNNSSTVQTLIAKGQDVSQAGKVIQLHDTLTTVNNAASPYTVVAADTQILCDATAGAVTLNLPAATGTGREISIKKTDSSANACTPTRAGSDLIDGATSYSLTVQYAASKITDTASAVWSRMHVNQLGGDLTGISVNATVAKVNGQTPGGTCTNQFARTIDSSGRPTCATVANTDLANASTTVNGQTCTLGSACTIPLSAVNPETTTYQVVAADFSNYKTITVASGTFTVTLVASGTQPAAGQFIRVLNYGSGVVTIARSGQNINGGTASYVIQSGSATNPESAFVESNGTDYFIKGDFTNPMTTSGDVIQATTTGLPTRIACTSGVFKGGTPGSCAALVASDLPVVPVPTPGTTITLSAPEGVAICTGTCTVTLPVPAAGYQFCIWNDDNVSTAITLAALGSSAMYENSARTAYGTAGTGTLVVGAAAADKVCIFGRDATHYQTVSFNGTVTVN